MKIKKVYLRRLVGFTCGINTAEHPEDGLGWDVHVGWNSSWQFKRWKHLKESRRGIGREQFREER